MSRVHFVHLAESNPIQAPVIDSLQHLCDDLKVSKKSIRHDDYNQIKNKTEQLWNTLEPFGRLLCQTNSDILGDDFKFTGLGSLKLFFKKIQKCSNISTDIARQIEDFNSPDSQLVRIVEARNSCMHGDSTPKMASLDHALGFANWLLMVAVTKSPQKVAQVGNESKAGTKAKPSPSPAKDCNEQKHDKVKTAHTTQIGKSLINENKHYLIKLRHSNKYLRNTNKGFIQEDEIPAGKLGTRCVFRIKIERNGQKTRLLLLDIDGDSIGYDIGEANRMQIEPLNTDEQQSDYFRLKVPKQGYLEGENEQGSNEMQINNEKTRSHHQQFRFEEVSVK